MEPQTKILDTIKKLLGIDPEYDVFDQDIAIHINSAIFSLHQLGIGVPDFRVVTGEETWSQFETAYLADMQSIKTYIYLKVRLYFDPPATSFAHEAMQKQINEIEWRLNVQRELKIKPIEEFIDDVTT